MKEDKDMLLGKLTPLCKVHIARFGKHFDSARGHFIFDMDFAHDCDSVMF